jgi:hypothetical protein
LTSSLRLVGQWGQGLGTQAALAGLEYGFKQLGLHEIWAEALDANVASVRVLQRIGMTEVEPGGPGVYLGCSTSFRRFIVRNDEWAVGSPS